MLILAGQPMANRIVAGVLGVMGIWLIIVGLRTRRQHPPLWVTTYRGGPCPALALPWLGMWGAFALPMTIEQWIPETLAGLSYSVSFASLILAIVGWWIWYPRFLTPRWYRAARRAGVDVRDPLAVEAFRTAQPTTPPPPQTFLP